MPILKEFTIASGTFAEFTNEVFSDWSPAKFQIILRASSSRCKFFIQDSGIPTFICKFHRKNPIIEQGFSFCLIRSTVSRDVGAGDAKKTVPLSVFGKCSFKAGRCRIFVYLSPCSVHGTLWSYASRYPFPGFF